MALTNGNPSSSSRSRAAPNGSATPSASTAVNHTNIVTTKDGRSVKTRIDPSLAVADVLKQLCVNLQMPGPAVDWALRDDGDELVTDDNLKKMIKTRARLKIVSAPVLEARETVERIAQREDPALRLTLYNLQRYIREPAFSAEFLRLGGLARLVDVIYAAHGNTLAYALAAMQNLMILDHGWAALDTAFVAHIVHILASPSSLINVCRPATAILKRLVEAGPANAPGPLVASSSRGPPPAPPGSVYRFGFDIVFSQLRAAPGALETVVSRIGVADTALALHSMMLINSLLAHATDTHWETFINTLEGLSTRKAVIGLMSSHMVDDLTSCVLDFQANMARVMYRTKTTYVEPAAEPAHANALDYIWTRARLVVERDEEDLDGAQIQWRQLGFETENLSREFGEVGVLGLYCLKYFVQEDPDFFAVVVQEQRSRAPERRCPLARASNEVVELLAEHWAIFAPGYAAAPAFQPFFLNFYKVHALALRFFLRMWNESSAGRADFSRIVALVRSQVKIALRQESIRPWHEMEQDFGEVEYRAVRDRQMKELVEEDDLLSKVPIRNLREKLLREAKEFVLQQRIHCLMQGAWFMNAIPITAPAPRRPARPWRFLRLDKGMKYLHYVDSAVKFPVRDGLEDLPERIELSLVSEIATKNCAPPPRADEHTLVASALSFSLMTNEGSLADLIAPDGSRWADWTDGLNMLRRDSGHVASQETADFIQALTDIGLKIKLLDLSGDKVEIPSGLSAGAPPVNSDFYFSDFYDPQ
ncbi:ELMO/CED-12 family-domain-containing protein [Vararia minispora EC-137]|uniref:ELMO/CED-12 family-domain-containing protein n=1 Tax=Vararia minispora EC-137 TaxID=1314806 RepID=A0ACB8QLY5_9AGAM|nr:ELMO/CED-12 family-domain-containing protein [Vararia minispora EC-137]